MARSGVWEVWKLTTLTEQAAPWPDGTAVAAAAAATTAATQRTSTAERARAPSLMNGRVHSSFSKQPRQTPAQRAGKATCVPWHANWHQGTKRHFPACSCPALFRIDARGGIFSAAINWFLAGVFSRASHRFHCCFRCSHPNGCCRHLVKASWWQ